MQWWHAIIIGIVEGITEFLPVSSTAHISVAASFFGYEVSDPSVTAFTAIIQVGAILAAVIYFRDDITRIATAWLRGLFNKDQRTFDYKFGWAVIIGSLPIVIAGLLFKDQVETVFRNLWWVVAGLLIFTVVMWYGDKYGAKNRTEKDLTLKDAIINGTIQAFSLIPGVSRSGATTTVGLLQGFDRVTVTRLSFFLGIPALLGAGALQTYSHYEAVGAGVGWTATIIATVTSFVVGYLCIDWLLKFVARHSFSVFIWYRFITGGGLAVLLLLGVVQP
ncbi:undecaprenyl-diphosphate phosphatase [Candidatus Saccharibacteria bacterium]|nr:undecaprenyl-diphosphate phosphatase [Candidatus Saccharibacteria bacterium]